MTILSRTTRILLPALSAALLTATAFASTITGTVTDRTTGKPSSGDIIAVINTAQSMDEIAKVSSDAQGRFQATAPDGGQILLHVTHHGADYFKSVPPGASSVQIDVYDSATKIDGITGEALVLRAETDAGGKTLNLAENFFVQNASAPPRTEYGGNTFDFYLPKGAVIMQTLASSPGGLPTNTEVKTLDAAGGHYAFTFPVRPGETRFQVVYTIPYNGKQAFSLKLSLPTGDVAVMLPKSMQFQGSSQFQPLNQDPSAQTYDDHDPLVAQPVQFAIAGAGQLPQEQQDAQGAAQGGGEQAAANGTRPGGGLGAPDDPNAINDPWAKYKWWILSALGLALVVGAGVMLKAGQPTPAAAVAGVVPPLPYAEASSLAAAQSEVYPAAAPVAGPGVLLHALKDELFVLETDRLAGRMTEAEYAQHKAAFDVVLRRAMARSEASPSASNQ
ncbi:MAG: carboxypeptidase-like regulatory domain-containing protein [Acidobacteriaceae bacterium]